MKALIDTCIIVDALQNRAPFEKDAQLIFLAAANNAFTGCITAKAVTDIYYLTHRYTHSGKESREVLNKLFALFDVLDTSKTDCINAAHSDISDYEDAVMIETAIRSKADCIITCNIKVYTKSPVKIYTPTDFIKLLEEQPE